MDDETNEVIKYLRSQGKNIKRSVDNAPQPKSYVKEMKFIQQELEKPTAPDNFHPDPEWVFNFTTWFANIRHHFDTEYDAPERSIPYYDALQNIEKNANPTPYSLNKYTSTLILSYYQKRNSSFNSCDLLWIFNCLIRIDQLLSPEMCVVLQNIQTIIFTQMQNLDKTNELFSQLSIVSIIISKYFNQ